MADKEKKIVTIPLSAPVDPAAEERALAAYRKKQARQAAAQAEAEQATRAAAAASSVEKFRRLNAEDYAELSSTPRRRAREASLLLLFQVEIGGCPWSIAEQVLADAGVKGKNAEFAIALARGAAAEREHTDRLLAAYAREWDVERFSAVDRVVLHLAVAELLHDERDEAHIIMNEAIELGKKFGSADSGPFINAMLDRIYSRDLTAAPDERHDTGN